MATKRDVQKMAREYVVELLTLGYDDPEREDLEALPYELQCEFGREVKRIAERVRKTIR